MNRPPKVFTTAEGFNIVRWSNSECEYGLVASPGIAAQWVQSL